MKNYEFEYTNWLSKKRGSAELGYNHLRLQLDEVAREVQFISLASYKVAYYNGVTLILGFSDGSKLKITANRKFCNEVPFEIFCDDLEDSLSRYTARNNPNLIRKSGIFEQQWMIVIPVFFTLGTSYVLVSSFLAGKEFTATIFGNILVTVSAWTTYLNVQKNKRDRLSRS